VFFFLLFLPPPPPPPPPPGPLLFMGSGDGRCEHSERSSCVLATQRACGEALRYPNSQKKCMAARVGMT
jgi:hypothetical protein